MSGTARHRDGQAVESKRLFPMDTTALPPLEWREPAPGAGERALRWGLVLALHGALGYAALYLSVKNELIALPPSLSVRLLPMIEEKKPELPPPPKPAPVRKALPQAAQPILTAKAPEAAPAAFVVPPQPPAPPPAPVAAPPAPPAPVVAARFDADYLHNPKPVYPALSRRNGEEGKVLLRVRVSAEGQALEVGIRQSSGFIRLDEAARDAVGRWRFVPARRGDEAIESWVVVPITFGLE